MSKWEMGMLAEWNGKADAYSTDIYQENTEKVVATAYDDNLTVRPNANFIAAAPDTLALLEDWQNAYLDPDVADWKRYESDFARRVDAAIAKAKGETL